jgi:hypothetical protein
MTWDWRRQWRREEGVNGYGSIRASQQIWLEEILPHASHHDKREKWRGGTAAKAVDGYKKYDRKADMLGVERKSENRKTDWHAREGLR